MGFLSIRMAVWRGFGGGRFGGVDLNGDLRVFGGGR